MLDSDPVAHDAVSTILDETLNGNEQSTSFSFKKVVLLVDGYEKGHMLARKNYMYNDGLL